MSHLLIDIAVVFILFVIGMIWTVVKNAKQDRLAFAIVAILSPVLVVWSVFRLFYLATTGQVKVGPCPNGLLEAERVVEMERQRLFGGDLREPTFARNWQRAYELELQREAEHVQRIALKVLVHA